MMDCCKTCRFFEEFGGKKRITYGWCHRYAPLPKIQSSLDDDSYAAYWPQVDAIEGYCGEYQPIEHYRDIQRFLAWMPPVE